MPMVYHHVRYASFTVNAGASSVHASAVLAVRLKIILILSILLTAHCILPSSAMCMILHITLSDCAIPKNENNITCRTMAKWTCVGTPVFEHLCMTSYWITTGHMANRNKIHAAICGIANQYLIFVSKYAFSPAALWRAMHSSSKSSVHTPNIFIPKKSPASDVIVNISAIPTLTANTMIMREDEIEYSM